MIIGKNCIHTVQERGGEHTRRSQEKRKNKNEENNNNNNIILPRSGWVDFVESL